MEKNCTGTPRHYGCKKNPNYLPYQAAVEVVQVEHIQSRSQYWKWWDTYRPTKMSKYPFNVYKEWKSWNHFLGNRNRFRNQGKRFRPFDDALIYARASGLQTYQDWQGYKKHPVDIPARPDIVYRGKGFLGWKHFLGTGKRKAADTVHVARLVQRTTVLAFLSPWGMPNNVVFVKVFPCVSAAKDFCANHQMRPLRIFGLEEDANWEGVLHQHATHQGNGEWIVSNLPQLFWDLNLPFAEGLPA